MPRRWLKLNETRTEFIKVFPFTILESPKISLNTQNASLHLYLLLVMSYEQLFKITTFLTNPFTEFCESVKQSTGDEIYIYIYIYIYTVLVNLLFVISS